MAEKHVPQEKDRNIHEIIKMTKQLKNSGKELESILEMTKTHAKDLDDLKIVEDKRLEDLKLLLDELKISAKRTSESGARLETCMGNLLSEADLNLIGSLMQEADQCKASAPSYELELSTKIGELFRRTREFHNEFGIFTCSLKKCEEQAANVTGLLLKKQKKIKIKHIVVTSTTLVGAGGLMALAFFTSGLFIPLVLFGAKQGYKYYKKQQKLAREVKAMADKQGVLAKKQKDISDMTGKFQVDLEAMMALEDAYKCHQLRMEEEKMAHAVSQPACEPRDAELSDQVEDLTARLENMLAKIQALQI